MKLNGSVVLAGFIGSLYGVFQLFASPVVGHLSDLYGRKRFLILSQIGMIASYLLMAFATTIPTLIFARILQGTSGGCVSLAQAYLADITEPGERTAAFGKVTMAMSLGFLLGPFFAGQLAEIDYRLPLFAAAFIVAIGCYFTWTQLPSKLPPREKRNSRNSLNPFLGLSVLLKDPKLRGVALVAFLHYFCVVGLTYGYPVFATKQLHWGDRLVSLKEYGYMFLYLGSVSSSIQIFFMKRLTGRFSDYVLAIAGLMSYAIGLLLLGSTENVVWILLIGLFTGFGMSVPRPCFSAILSKELDPAVQGLVMGANQSLFALGIVFSPVIGSMFLDRGMTGTWALFQYGISLLGAVILMLIWGSKDDGR